LPSPLIRSIGDVLDLYLTEFATDQWVRPVLVAVAHAKENGLPERPLDAIATRIRRLHDGETVPELEDWRIASVIAKTLFLLRLARAAHPERFGTTRLLPKSSTCPTRPGSTNPSRNHRSLNYRWPQFFDTFRASCARWVACNGAEVKTKHLLTLPLAGLVFRPPAHPIRCTPVEC
jgi:hypothetical protein